MKKYGFLILPLLVIFCAVSSTTAQIKVINGSSSASEVIDPDGKRIEDPGYYDPDKYLNELRAKTLDQYAAQIIENLLKNLQSNAVLLESLVEYTLPAADEVKANFFAQVQEFGFSDVTGDTLLGDFVDRVAQTLAAKLAALTAIEKQILGIKYMLDSEDPVKIFSRQVIWMLESSTTQKYYDEIYSLMATYIWLPIKSRDVVPEPVMIDAAGNVELNAKR